VGCSQRSPLYVRRTRQVGHEPWRNQARFRAPSGSPEVSRRSSLLERAPCSSVSDDGVERYRQGHTMPGRELSMIGHGR
jgi:hypothetical protein